MQIDKVIAKCQVVYVYLFVRFISFIVLIQVMVFSCFKYECLNKLMK